jgi:hypothetical protein
MGGGFGVEKGCYFHGAKFISPNAYFMHWRQNLGGTRKLM